LFLRFLDELAKFAEPRANDKDSTYNCTGAATDVWFSLLETALLLHNAVFLIILLLHLFASAQSILLLFTNTMASTKSPPDALKALYAAGIARADMTMDVLIIQSIMAGVYIGMATHLLLAIGGGPLGAVFFPIGLLAILLTSGELFTGDILIFLPSVLSGHVSWTAVARNWTVSWFGNMAGCVIWAYFIVYLPGSLEDIGKNEFAINVALKKANQTWGSIFLKGVGANFMVCLAIYQATCSGEVISKLTAIFLPLSGFVMMGLEHCIANQFIIRKLLFL
jgi:formate/nitrite transporter